VRLQRRDVDLFHDERLVDRVEDRGAGLHLSGRRGGRRRRSGPSSLGAR
jgi:hypothetical protein